MELAGAVWANLFLGSLALVRGAFQTDFWSDFAPGSREKQDNCGVLNQVSLHRSGRGSGVPQMSGDS